MRFLQSVAQVFPQDEKTQEGIVGTNTEGEEDRTICGGRS